MHLTHIPVLKNEAVEGLAIRKNGTYVDGTFGFGGHAMEIISRLNGDGCFVGIDQDGDAFEKGRARLSEYRKTHKDGCSLHLVRDNFSNLPSVLHSLQISEVHGILLDIGVSSYQLDTDERGFSYMHDAPLDMRMDDRNRLTAADVVNTYPEEELSRVIFRYGEERWASRIASFIVSAREKKRVETTWELVDIIKAAIPSGARKDGPHPARRTFQAIRIEVNDELSVLSRSIRAFMPLLAPGGRLAIITFHSLEDRLVKQTFASLQDPCTCPPSFPVCVCGKKPVIKIITKKPIVPEDSEISENPRSRSAKLRIAEKLP